MKKFVFTLALAFGSFFAAQAQNTIFQETIKIPAGYALQTVLFPPSPLTMQILFIGGVDMVETTKTYGNPAGKAVAKEWHDFIGFTADNTGKYLGWVSVNHEMIYHDDRIGDGGGMTVFAVKRDPITGLLEVAEQELQDGRRGKFFNVDFANTVGETGMNCAGIQGPDGRIWTAEEWFRTNNASINNGVFTAPTNNSWYPKAPGNNRNQGVRDTSDFTIVSDIEGFDGLKVKKFENFNWMVEIDPREAKAIRKQYNWGRHGFEGGIITSDNRTVYIGGDVTGPAFIKFVADTPGDFTKGKTYAYKQNNPQGSRWIEIDNTSPQRMINFINESAALGATSFTRMEWVAYDKQSGLIYVAETGNDNPVGAFNAAIAGGATIAQHHNDRAISKGLTGATDPAYRDYYGRILVYNPATEEISVLMEGGPEFGASPSEANYPDVHLSNPDGLYVLYIDGKSFLVIEEDLIGVTFGRMPAGATNAVCEAFLLDLSIQNPTWSDLIRLTATPYGAEITGCVMTSDGKTLLINSQHPNSDNPYPFNHSLTFALHGWDKLKVTDLQDPVVDKTDGFVVYPNPTTRRAMLNRTTDLAIYNVQGQRVRTYRNTNQIDVSNLTPGTYYILTAEGETSQLIIQE